MIKELTKHGIGKMHLHMIHRPWDFVILASLHVGQFHGLPKSSFSNGEKTHTFGAANSEDTADQTNAGTVQNPFRQQHFDGFCAASVLSSKGIYALSRAHLDLCKNSPMCCLLGACCEHWLDVICDPSHCSPIRSPLFEIFGKQ